MTSDCVKQIHRHISRLLNGEFVGSSDPVCAQFFLNPLSLNKTFLNQPDGFVDVLLYGFKISYCMWDAIL